MSLKEKINSDLKEALKQRQEVKISVLRLLNAAIYNKEIEKFKRKEGLSDNEVFEIINSEIKKRRDAYELYTKGNRIDAAEKEKIESNILAYYLPPQLTEVDLRVIIKEAVSKTHAKTEKDFGQLMKEVVGQTKGRADSTQVVKLVKEFLDK